MSEEEKSEEEKIEKRIFDTRDPEVKRMVDQVMAVLYAVSDGQEGVALAICLTCVATLEQKYGAMAGIIATGAEAEKYPVAKFGEVFKEQ